MHCCHLLKKWGDGVAHSFNCSTGLCLADALVQITVVFQCHSLMTFINTKKPQKFYHC